MSFKKNMNGCKKNITKDNLLLRDKYKFVI